MANSANAAARVGRPEAKASSAARASRRAGTAGRPGHRAGPFGRRARGRARGAPARRPAHRSPRPARPPRSPPIGPDRARGRAGGAGPANPGRDPSPSASAAWCRRRWPGRRSASTARAMSSWRNPTVASADSAAAAPGVSPSSVVTPAIGHEPVLERLDEADQQVGLEDCRHPVGAPRSSVARVGRRSSRMRPMPPPAGRVSAARRREPGAGGSAGTPACAGPGGP